MQKNLIPGAAGIAHLAETYGVDADATRQALRGWLENIGGTRSKYAAARHAAGHAKYLKKKAKRKGKR